MKKFKNWFKNLSTIAKTGVISAAALTLIAFGSVGAQPSTSVTPKTATPSAAAEAKKEPVVTTKTETETQPIAFEKQTVESDTLAAGQTQITTTGVDGVKTITHTITLTDGVETGRTSAEAITTTPITEVTTVGTYVAPKKTTSSNCNPNYSGCVPNVSYDLNCKDIKQYVTVLGYDQYNLDGDGDGGGCESYR